MPTELTPLLRYCLDTTTVRLADEFHGVFSPETVRRHIEDAHEQIGDRPTVGPNFLPVIIERFAASSCGRSRKRRARSRSRYPRCCSCASTTPGAARWPPA